MARRLGLAAFALVVVAGLGLWFAGGPGSSRDGALVPFAAEAQETTAAPADGAAIPAVPDMVLGNPDAKVTLTEYASFTCPHCAHFHETVFKPLKKDYIDTGKVKFVYREVYFDRYGLWAAMMARCGGEMRFFGIAGILFDTQKEWAASDDPNVVVANLKKIGRTAGLEDAAVGACMEDAAMAQAMVEKYKTTSAADNVEGTPTLLVNGTKYSNMTYEELKKILDAELAK